MFYCLTTIFSIVFYNSLICLSFVIKIFYLYTVPGTKHHRFMFSLTFSAMPSFFRHQKNSGRQSIYKGENLYCVSCILGFIHGNRDSLLSIAKGNQSFFIIFAFMRHDHFLAKVEFIAGYLHKYTFISFENFLVLMQNENHLVCQNFFQLKVRILTTQ